MTVLALVGAMLAWTLPKHQKLAPAPEAAPFTAPWEFSVDIWDTALGGDQGLNPQRYADLTDWRDSALDTATTTIVRTQAEQVARADLVATGRTAFPGYWPAPPPSGAPAPVRCRNVSIRAVSSAHLPTVKLADGVEEYAKSLVAYTGTCGTSVYTSDDPGVTYVYAQRTAAGWAPVHSWNIPASPAPTDDPQAATEPAEWELKQFSTCASTKTLFRDRILVVDAFELMCKAARADGVSLEVTAAYRTRAEQATLFAAAVKSYGGEAEARKWVAYADAKTCTSRHCSGVAVNVVPTSAAVAWLGKTVGCDDGRKVIAATSCAPGSTTVPQLARWGFTSPLPAIPGYLEFTLPTQSQGDDSATGALSGPDCTPTGIPVANAVAAIFRCRLAREGVVGLEQAEVVSQALVVSRCESGWNASARAFAGRFTTAPNPVDNQLYTQTGVFMISAATADASWVVGGANALTDPVANINAAASLWLSTRGWEQFGCATGTQGGFEVGPVLPSYGGPTLPTWSNRY